MTIRIYFFILLGLLSCFPQEKNNNSDLISQDSTIKEVPTSESDSLANIVEEKVIPSKPENFEDFLLNFNNDSIFQVSRIIYPFKVRNVDIEDLEMIEYIEKANWQHLDLTYDSSNFYRKYSKYKMIIKNTGDSAIVGYRGIDNGIFSTYHFVAVSKPA